MVFVDTDVLSIFAKIQRLSLLFAVFHQDQLNIATAVENEIKIASSKGFHFAHEIIELNTQGQIRTHRTTSADQKFMRSLPQTLDAGERESMALCKRLKAILVSNERRVMHHCGANRIDCINLAQILRTLWKLNILTQTDVRQVITEIETKDNLKFRTTEPIFK
ncbi:hypothetical protein J4G08_02605 [Candidatus Poribacteria bacterium]|nr:hypothetical protein [Candidatus Poribacteria bacterium]